MYTTSEQHKEANIATRKRDKKDTEVIKEYLYDRNPFNSEAILKSNTSGVVSHDSDADQTRDIGEKVVSKLVGKTVKEFRKKDIIVQINDTANRSTQEIQLPQTVLL